MYSIKSREISLALRDQPSRIVQSFCLSKCFKLNLRVCHQITRTPQWRRDGIQFGNHHAINRRSQSKGKQWNSRKFVSRVRGNHQYQWVTCVTSNSNQLGIIVLSCGVISSVSKYWQSISVWIYIYAVYLLCSSIQSESNQSSRRLDHYQSFACIGFVSLLPLAYWHCASHQQTVSSIPDHLSCWCLEYLLTYIRKRDCF